MFSPSSAPQLALFRWEGAPTTEGIAGLPLTAALLALVQDILLADDEVGEAHSALLEALYEGSGFLSRLLELIHVGLLSTGRGTVAAMPIAIGVFCALLSARTADALALERGEGPSAWGEVAGVGRCRLVALQEACTTALLQLDDSEGEGVGDDQLLRRECQQLLAVLSTCQIGGVTSSRGCRRSS
jgi:hypothetical protein